MGVAKRLVDGMAQKSADHIEKFVRTLLDMSIEHWAEESNKKFKAAAGHSMDRGEDTSDEVQAYYAAFRNWHSLRQTKNNFEKWLDVTLSLPDEVR